MDKLEKDGCFYGLYPGVVVNNQDAENAFRIQVKVPAICGDETIETWALPFAIPNGTNQGVLSLPKVGQNVWVMFDNGDVEFPLWTYGCFRLNEAPQPYNDKKYIIKTQNNEISIDDDENEIWIKQPNFEIKLTNEGVFLGKESVNLKSFLDELFELLKTAKVITALGPQPFTPDTIIQIQQLQNKIDQFLI